MGEPYKKVGRGGAGNFYNKKDIEDVLKNTASADPESQSASQFSTHTLARALSSSQPPPEYLHTGRGGAGNWMKPVDLESQGLTQSPSNTTSTALPTSNPFPPSTTTSPTSSSSSSIGTSKRVLGGSPKPTYKGGRGGAGNYTNFEEEERLRKQEEEQLRIEMEGRVIRDVEAGLARPERAYGGIAGSWEMGAMK